MNLKHGLASIILVVLLAAIIGGGYFFAQKAGYLPDHTPSDIIQPMSVAKDWKEYSDNSLSFEYSNVLSLRQDGERVTLSHSVAYKHGSPCDFKGDAPPLKMLTDFSVSFQVVDKSPKDYVQSSGWPDWEYVSKNPFKQAAFSGFKISSGVEGCGQDIYYLVISPNKTLVITRPFVSEFNSVNGDYQTYLNLPGVISPNQGEEFFTKILSSVRFTK